MKMKNKVLISVLAMLLCSVGAFAEETIDINNPSNGDGYTWSSPTLTITTGGDYIITGTGATIGNRIVVNSGVTANITIENVNINMGSSNFSIASNATVYLTLMGTNTLRSGNYNAALEVPNNATLIITDTSTGSLTATAGSRGAGIGGNDDAIGGNITINGGTVTANGGGESYGFNGGTGIGGGRYRTCNSVTINGGTVIANGGNGGADGGGGGGGAINGGIVIINGGTVTATGGNYLVRDIHGGSGINGNITINGGMVTAKGGARCAGIGGGYGASIGKLTVNGGTVVASSISRGSGIGGGLHSGNNGAIIINGGTVTATTNDKGAGIGGGEGGKGSNITITGGTVTATSPNGAGIGSGSGGSSSSGITITGGSVKCSSISQPTDGNGNDVYLNTFTIGFDDGNDNQPVTAGSIDEIDCNEIADAPGNVYGIKDVKTDATGKVYFYLPESEGGDEDLVALTVDDCSYRKSYARTSAGNSEILIPPYYINLSQTETYSFPAASYGYAAQTARSITVSNAGYNATGNLTVALSGTNAESFTLSTDLISSIAVDGTGSFTVKPNTNLSAGTTYTATVTVSGEHISDRSFIVSFTVNKKGITISTGAIEAKTYDGSNAVTVTGVTFNGLENEETLAITTDYTVSSTTFTNVNAGSGNRTVQMTVALNNTPKANNYNLTGGTNYQLTGQSIAKATFSPTVSLAGWTYGGIASTPSVSGNTSGGEETYKYATTENGTYGTTRPSNAETYYVKAYIAETDNYNSATTSAVSFTIARANFSPTVSLSGWTYGGTASTPSVSGNTSGGAETYKYATTENGTYGTTRPSNAETYYVKAYIAETDNYNSATTGAVSFTITAKDIIITPDANQSKIYGQSDPAFTYTCNPVLIEGDKLKDALSRVAGENPGTYLIEQGTLVDPSGNYVLTFTPGVLFTINPTNPRLLQDLEDAIVCVGGSHTFEIEAEGDNLSYEWYYGNERIKGANGNTYTITNAEFRDYERYHVIVRSDLGSYHSSVYSKEVRFWVADQLPENLRFVDFPSTVTTGKTYRIKLDGYPDVTQYSWSYRVGATLAVAQNDGVTFSPETGGVGNNETLATFGILSAGQGMLTVTLEHPCGARQATQAIEVQFPTGVDQIAEPAVRVFPNPTAGIIKVSGTKSNQFIRIVDITGSLKGTYLAQDGETTIDMTDYSKGTYLIQYNGKTVKAMRK